MNSKPTILLSAFLLSVAHSLAATYYVDFANGDNQADGLSARTAWKQSPGDKQATNLPASVELEPGDIIKFKGGVTYFGEIELSATGTEDQPIILDGNTDGSYGEGRAILDGAQMITDWQSVSSVDMVKGNPRWKDIVYADIDVDLTSNFNQDSFIIHRDGKQDRQAPWQRIFLIDGERSVLPIAQTPKPSDPFYPDIPEDFYESPDPIQSNYPHKISYEEGSIGNRSLPLIAITYGGSAPVIQPFNGGAVSVEMNESATISEIGFTLFRPTSTPVPEQIVFFADDQEIYQAQVNPEETAMQRFKLPQPVDSKKLTFQLRHSAPGDRTWTKLQQIAAFTPDGTNVIEHEVSSAIHDEVRFTQKDPSWFDDMFIGVHGGNNHVYFAQIKEYNPASKKLKVPHFTLSTYRTTKYAFYNSTKFISLPGEWCLQPLEGGRTRVFLLPEHTKNGQPENIGFPRLKTAITLSGEASNLEVRGFLMQRYSGGNGGFATKANGTTRPSNIRLADSEIRFMSGQSGISLNHSDNVTVENCYIHHCPGWTVGIYVNRINHYKLSGNRLDTNSGSGIRHYESKNGVITGNAVLNHYGIHSSGLNFYEGCSDILFEGNYVQNVIAINRNAENLTFRNNVVDSENKTVVSVALWSSGSIGGKEIKNLLFENNTFINSDETANWATSIFVQNHVNPPEGLVIRNNVLNLLRPKNPGTIENNIFMTESDPSVAGTSSLVVSDPEQLFIDPAHGDYRRKPGGPMMDAGANIPAPSPAP